MEELEKTEDYNEIGINVLAIVRTLISQKWIILAITLAAGVIAALYSLRLPNVYSATAKVLPPQKDTSGISAMIGQMGSVASLAGVGKGVDGELYLSLLKSRSLGDAVIQRLDLVKVFRAGSLNAARGRLAGSLKVQSGKDALIYITVEDQDPKLAALLANTVADELGRTLVRLNLSKVGPERTFLEKRLELVKKDLNKAEEDLRSFSTKNGLAQVEAQTDASVSTVARIKNDIGAKEVQLAALRASHTDESPEVRSLQAAIKRQNEKLAEAAGHSKRGDGVLAIGSVPGVGLEYSRRMREVKAQEALYEQLAKQYEVAKFSEAKDSSYLQILDEALVPEARVRPARVKITALGMACGFVFSVVVVLLKELCAKMPDEDRALLREIAREAFSLRGREAA